MDQKSLFNYLETNLPVLSRSAARSGCYFTLKLTDHLPNDQKIWFTALSPHLPQDVIDNPSAVKLKLFSDITSCGMSIWIHPSGIGSYYIWGKTRWSLGCNGIINGFASDKELVLSIIQATKTFYTYSLESLFTQWAEAHDYKIDSKTEVFKLETDDKLISIEVIRYGIKSDPDQNGLPKQGSVEGLIAFFPGYWWTLKRDESGLAIKELTRGKHDPNEFIKWMDDHLVL